MGIRHCSKLVNVTRAIGIVHFEILLIISAVKYICFQESLGVTCIDEIIVVVFYDITFQELSAYRWHLQMTFSVRGFKIIIKYRIGFPLRSPVINI